jgi:hypothetical protein
MRRAVVVLAVAVVWAGAGSALLASPALAGGVDTSDGYLNGALYNVTPYTWTKVAQASPATCYGKYADGTGGRATSNCWDVQEPAATIAPGGATGYTVLPNVIELPVLGNLFSTKFGYDAWVTYRVDVLGGAPEYVTFTVSQCYCTFTYGSSYPRLDVWDTTAPPPASYDPGTNPASPAPETAKPQVTYSHNVPYLFDQSFQIAGDYTVDASTSLGAPFVDVLNAVCVNAASSSCSFTQTGPLTWGIGTAVKKVSAENCTVTGVAKGGSSPGAVGGEPPPPLDPNWAEMEYEEAQSATLSVGGSVAVGTEFNLFDSISGKISVKVEAEHEWQEVQSLTKTTRVYIPSNNIAAVWVAPVVGKVTGTLVLSSGSAMFTVKNFSETRSGVSKDDLTPAFNVITRVRAMTAGEYAADCRAQSSTGLGSTRSLGSVRGRPPVRLVAGRGVARVRLGQTQAQVLRQLGAPSVRLFSEKACRGLDPGCGAVPARGGIWMFRRLSVMFGIDRRVSALIYRGAQRSARGVGVGSGMTAVRRAYRGVSCTSAGKRRYCTLRGALVGQAVKTVFRFINTGAGRYRCDRVLIYLLDPRSGQVRA